jgi:predicted Fe-Mo cluster-binding NifX family protein
MRAAFSYLDDRIAPAFDTARQIVLIELTSKRIVRESQEFLAADLPVQKAIHLAELSVNALICGAISKPLHEMIAAYGTEVVPFVTGDLKEVIYAWVNNRIYERRFAMPGCRGAERHALRKRGLNVRQLWTENKVNYGKESVIMPRGDGTGPQGTGKRGGGMGAGGGRGQNQSQGQAGRGGGRMGGTAAAGPAGFCVCSQCGERRPHKLGVPCFEQKCSKCGVALMRE